MISQLQNLQTFVHNHLADVVDWRKHVSPDPERKMAGVADPAYILIATPFNRYKMAMATAYAEPPAGAPVNCRALGWITFYDPADNKQIVSAKADAAYTEISKHVHVRELTDALAAARREMAEASPETACRARVKLAGLAERAKKWGIFAKVPEGSATEPQPAPQAGDEPQAASAPVAATSAANEPTASVQSDQAGQQPFLGAPVIFISNPGERISGMQEIPGHVVRVQPDGRISMLVTADNSETIYRDNLPRRGSSAGNGKVHQFNCWDFNPEFERQRARIGHIEEAIKQMADDAAGDRQAIADLAAGRQTIADLAARLAVLENERGPQEESGRDQKNLRLKSR